MNSQNDWARWKQLSTSLISDSLDRFQVMDAGIRRMSGDRLFGPAYPAKAMVGESSTLHQAIAQAPPGSVVVVDAEGYSNRAVWGEVLTVGAQTRGLVGAVIDGAVRDSDAIRSRGFCLYARGVSPAGPHKGWRGRIGQPIQCGGVLVAPGDLIIGDADGVVVVPADLVEVTLESANARHELEREWIRRIEAGESSLAILGLNESNDDKGRDAQ